jgi:hypothetical protein
MENITERMYFDEESIHILQFYLHQNDILNAPKLNSKQKIIKCVMLQIAGFF